MSEERTTKEGRSDSRPGDEPAQSGEEVARRPAGGALPFWRRRWFREAVLCVGVFLIGAAVGSSITSVMVHHRMRRIFSDPEAAAEHRLERMSSTLGLSDQQAAQIRPFVVAFHRKIIDSFRQAHDAMSAEIERFLTDEQTELHRRIVREKRRRFPGPGGDAGPR